MAAHCAQPLLLLLLLMVVLVAVLELLDHVSTALPTLQGTLLAAVLTSLHSRCVLLYCGCCKLSSMWSCVRSAATTSLRSG
jgi:hypothetical protein